MNFGFLWKYPILSIDLPKMYEKYQFSKFSMIFANTNGNSDWFHNKFKQKHQKKNFSACFIRSKVEMFRMNNNYSIQFAQVYGHQIVRYFKFW